MNEPWLHDFLKRQLFGGKDRFDGRCVRLQLFHLAGRPRGVRTWSVPETVLDSYVEECASEILAEAQADAAELFGRQRYSICAYHERRPSEVAESRAFSRHGGGSASDSEDDVDSEAPNQRGLLAQFMRHNEATMRAVVANTQQMLEAMNQQYATATARNTELEARNMENVRVYETLLSERTVREQAVKESDLKQKMWADAFSKMSLLVPVIVNKLAGARILPEPAAVMDEMVGSLVGSITTEQMAELGKVLRPEQQIVVLNLVDAQRKREERQKEEQEAQRRVIVADGNGVPPVAGIPS